MACGKDGKQMNYVICIIVGYLLGSINPAALISKIRRINLRKRGTGNLGATNTLLTFGKWFFAIVLAFDIAKAFAVVKLANLIFPENAAIGMVAGGAAIVGHIWPFYMNFNGGKGLAAFGGLVLAVDPAVFGILLATALILIVITNHGIAMPMCAGALFPLLFWLRGGDTPSVIITAAIGVVIILKNLKGLKKAIRGEDVKVRPFIKRYILKKEA